MDKNFETKLKELVKEAVHEVLNESTDIWHESKVKKVINNEPIDEMARINMKETGNSLFPSNKFRLWIWSNDHEPAHFHVDYPQENYECSFCIDDGSLLEVKGNSNYCSIHKEVVRNVKKWLKMPCAINPKITNKENAYMAWLQHHENLY